MSEDKPSEKWSKCAFCCEEFTSDRRPTTLDCGHAVCIIHMTDKTALIICPICFSEVKFNRVYHVSFALEEAIRLFELLSRNEPTISIKKPSNKIRKKPLHNPFSEEYEEALRRVETSLDEMEVSSRNKKR